MLKYIHNSLGLASIYVVFDGSSFNEKHKGSSHLMEHIVCKNYDPMLSELTANNIEANAGTADNEVKFYFRGLQESLDKFAETLIEKIMAGMLCTKEQFENEKKTVIEEYKDVFNNQSKGHYYNLRRQLLNDFGPIGTFSDIEKFDYELCQEVIKERFMIPSRIVLVGESEAFSKIETKFADYKFADPIDFSRELKVDNYHVPVEVVNKDQKTSVLGMSKRVISKEKLLEVLFLIEMLNDGLEAPLFKAIREDRGLSYFSWLFTIDIGLSSVVMFGACTANENANELVSVYKDFFDKVEEKVTKERFNIVKQKQILQVKENRILKYCHCTRELTNARDGYTLEQIEALLYEDVIKQIGFLKEWQISTY